MCSTKALLGGDGDVIADIYRQRVMARGKGSEVWGWGSAYGRPEKPSAAGPSGLRDNGQTRWQLNPSAQLPSPSRDLPGFQS